MSRFEVQLGEGVTFAYGYDRPLMEYFYQYFDADDMPFKENAGPQSVLLNEMNHIGMDKFPEKHIQDVAMDLPIQEDLNKWVR
jgi:hypothetical protein